MSNYKNQNNLNNKDIDNLNQNLSKNHLIEDLKDSFNEALKSTSEIMSQLLENIDEIVEDEETKAKSISTFNQLSMAITNVVKNIENQAFSTSIQFNLSEEE
jgi:methyl-accepting chemotaxis protein